MVFVDPDDIPANRITWLSAGDIIVVRSGAYTGDSALIRGEHCPSIAGFDMVLKPLACDASFLQYSLLSNYLKNSQIDLEKLRAAQPHLNAEELGACVVVLPPRSEQPLIAAFLDRETAKIDALIAEQEKLIALMQEKRQAVISHAVTKGLDPSVPMKDSGVEWLGEVPAHWHARTFRRCVEVEEGQVDPEVAPYDQMALIAPNHVESGTGRLLALETAADQGAESGKYLCRTGDVVYSKIRPALRKACLAPEPCLCSADMYPLRAHSGLDNRYLLWFILSECFSAWAVVESQRVAMPKINRESLAEVVVTLPPIREQAAIATFLDRETAKIDALIANATSAIALLKERRAALISAAVTGQIDVSISAELRLT